MGSSRTCRDFLLAILLIAPVSHCQVFANNNSTPERRWLLKFRDEPNLNQTENIVEKSYEAIDVPTFPELQNGKTSMSTSGVHWYSEIPLLPILFAESTNLPDSPCKRQTQRYLQELRNGTLWAARMFDSATKYPDGIFSGNTRHFGNFDQCYNLHVDLGGHEESGDIHDREIRGKYCLINLNYHRRDLPPSNQGPHKFHFDPQDSMWEALRERGDNRRVPRSIIQTALCVPSSCTANDIEVALRGPLQKISSRRNLVVKVNVDSRFCQTAEDVPAFSLGAKVYCGLLLCLLALVIVSTCYHTSLLSSEVREERSLGRDLLLCFSARKNIKSIFEVSYWHPGLDSIHFIRVFFTFLVLVGHRTMQYYSNPTQNAEYLEMGITIPSSMMLFNGPIIVDGFFSLGGLLLSFGVLEELDKKKKLNFAAAILIRFIRLTPLYMLVIFFHSLIMPHLGSGPYWEYKIGMERDNCANYWWASLFYINNYIGDQNMCMFQSWYLSVDYHMYIISLFVIYAFWKLPRRIGYSFLIGLTLFTCLIPFSVTYFKRESPLFVTSLKLRDVRDSPYFVNYYIKTHMRMAPYFIGIIAGAIIYDHKKNSYQLSKIWSHTLFILLAVILSIMSQALAYPYFNPGSKFTLMESAMYAAFHRPAFAISMCAVVVLLSVGSGLDFQYNFLTPGWMQPLAKLTYGAYLIHNINQIYDIGVQRTSRTFTIHNMFWDFASDVVYTFSLSLLLAIGIEGPFRKIEKRLLSPKSKKTTQKDWAPTVAKKIS